MLDEEKKSQIAPFASGAENKPHLVEAATTLFIKDLGSLRQSMPLMIFLLDAARSAEHEKYKSFVRDFCKPTGNDGGFFVPRERYSYFHDLDGKLQSAELSRTIIPRTLLVSLVSQYDAFLARLVGGIFLLKPDTLLASSRSMEFSKIVTYSTVDEIRQYFIDTEVESLLRKSHHEQFDWLEKKFDLKLRVDLAVWPEFIELTQRRNLFVHADGVISEQYLTVCRQNGVKIPQEIKLGSVVSADVSYLLHAYEVLFEISVKLSQVLWRTQEKRSDSSADVNLNKICIELLVSKQYKLATKLLDFAMTKSMKHPDKQNFLYLLINRANAYRLAGDVEACKRIVSAEDWTTCSAKYRLANAVLVGDMPQVVATMQEIGPTGEPSKHQYREWPLFRSIEMEASFLSTFELVFGEAFSLGNVEVKNEEFPETETIH